MAEQPLATTAHPVFPDGRNSDFGDNVQLELRPARTEMGIARDDAAPGIKISRTTWR
jgi:hypothetical protein